MGIRDHFLFPGHLRGGGLLWLGCLLSPWLFAQKPVQRFEKISLKQGLTEGTVSCIFQDRDGFIWLGTENGLNRFDGYSIEVYKHDSRVPDSISDNFIETVYEDSEGYLWVGTMLGKLNRLDPSRKHFEHFVFNRDDPKNGENWVLTLYEDANGTLWVGTRGSGLFKMDRERHRFEALRHDPEDPGSLSGNHVKALHMDRAGILWVGTQDGLSRLDPGAAGFRVYRPEPDDPQSLSHAAVSSIHEDRTGTLWVGTEGGGLNRFDRETEKFRHYRSDPNNPFSLGGDWITALEEDPNEGLWVGTHFNGLDWFDPVGERFYHYRHDSNDVTSLSHNRVYDLYMDRSGVLWVGTFVGGVNKLSRVSQSFALYKHDHVVSSIYEDREGRLWIGSYAGLHLFDRENNRIDDIDLPEEKRGPHDLKTVNAITQDRDGNLWVGAHSGLIRMADGRKEKVLVEGAGHFPVRCLFIDHAGQLWVGGLAGLYRYLEECQCLQRFEVPSATPNSFGQNFIQAIQEDREGFLWLGTHEGLFRVDRLGDASARFPHQSDDPHSLINDFVNTLYEDDRGKLWIGTQGGLSQFEATSNRFINYHDKDGVPNGAVFGILGDDQGFLWISTSQGLLKFDPAKRAATLYDRHNGLQENEFFMSSYFKSPRGEIFFGGINGFNAFFPDRIRVNRHVPPIVITDVQINHESVSKDDYANADGAMVLEHFHSVISFEFAALDFAIPEKNQYAYRLIGYDEDWINTHAGKRYATYTNLEPGEYAFRVKGSNNDGVWNEQGRTVRIVMLSPWWKTWWAYSLYFLAIAFSVGGFVFSLYHRRKLAYQQEVNERLRQVDRLKDEFLANTSHELRTPLNGIIGMAESMLEGVVGNLPQKISANLKMIVASAKRLASQVNDILDFSKLRNKRFELNLKPIDLRSLTEVVFTLCRYLIGRKNIRLMNEIPADMVPVEADEDRLLQIMNNLMDNAIKYTDEGCVRVTAEAVAERVVICVTDTGIGIPKEQFQQIFESFEQSPSLPPGTYRGTGLGLAISRKLVNLHGGDIWVESTLGQGSSFYFSLPISSREAVPLGPEEPPPTQPDEMATPAALVVERERDAQGQGRFDILIVDDEPLNRQVLINHLAHRNYNVTACSSGTQALELLASGSRFHLVLLDIMMPGISGYEVCRKIRERYPIHEMPVLFLTAKDQPNDLTAAFEIGANDYLVKPVVKKELLARVQIHLQLLDITRELDRKVAERTRELETRNKELLEAQRRLIEMDHLKTKFFTDLSHDFRTPLTLIIGPLHDILKGHYGRVGAKVKQNLEIILTHAWRFLKLVDQLLDHSKLEAGRMSLQVKKVNIAQFVAENVKRFGPLAERKQIKLGFQCDQDEILAYVDPDKLEKILYNLLDNAFKYTAPQEKVWISVTPARKDEKWVRILVKDTGRGIPKDRLDQIFNRYYQVEGPDGKNNTGVGIGLALVQELVRLHKGEIYPQSELGYGTEFTITLPLGKQHFAPEEISYSPFDGAHLPDFKLPDPERLELEPLAEEDNGEGPANGNATSILVVEDDPHVRAYIRGLFKPYRVLEAGNGEDALKIAQKELPDLVVSDVMMPGMDGYELCRALKDSLLTNHIPVVLLTAKASEESKKMGLEQGAIGYIVKPPVEGELLLLIKNILEKRLALKNLLMDGQSIHASESGGAEIDFITSLEKILDTLKKEDRFQELNRDLLAAKMHMSVRNFGRKMVQIIDTTPRDYIREGRLKFARELLEHSGLNLQEIAFKVGYNKYAHFLKQFKARFKTTPSEYRTGSRRVNDRLRWAQQPQS